MGLKQWFYIVLIASQLWPCWGVCNVYDHPSSEQISKCRKMKEMFEKALTGNKHLDNVFILREAFMSNSHPPPKLMQVTYIYYTESISAQSPKALTLLWSSSRIFTIIHPKILLMLRSVILFILIDLGGITHSPDITLTLTVTESPNIKPSADEIEYVFSTITEELQFYAYDQNDPDKPKRGFAIQPLNSASISPWTSQTILLVESILFLVLTGFLFTGKYLTQISHQIREYPSYMKLNYFWSFVQVTMMMNALELGFQFRTTLQELERRDPVSPLKVFSLGTSIVAMIVGTVCWYVQRENGLPPLLSHSKEMFSSCTFKFWKHFNYCTAMCTIYLFVALVCTNIIPMLILMFAYPIMVLSIVAYVITSVFCLVVVVFLPVSLFLSIGNLIKSRNVNEFMKKVSHSCNSVPIILFVITVTLILFLYLSVLYKCGISNTNDLSQAASSFFPSLILGTIGFFMKNLSTRKTVSHDKQTELHCNSVSSDTNCLKLAEEGITPMDNTDDADDESAHLLLNIEDTKL